MKIPLRSIKLRRSNAMGAKVMVFAVATAVAFGATGFDNANAGAIITNGVVTLGVDDQGQLNIPGGTPSLGGPPLGSTTIVGLRFNANNAEGTAQGCLCEGWGVGIAAGSGSPFSGFANNFIDTPPVNLLLSSFSSTASTAISKVTINGVTGIPSLQVTHNFHPSASLNLYQVDVTIKNISGSVLGTGVTDLRYRRVMDWDVEPTPFKEVVTIGGLPAANVIRTGDNGFSTGNPLSLTGGLFGGAIADLAGCGLTANFTDCGPADHGSVWDFGFPALADGAEQSLKIFYGAAATEADADLARAIAGVEIFSYGQCDPAANASCNITAGTPNTFIFGFAGVGGTPEGGPPPTVPMAPTLVLLMAGLLGMAAVNKTTRM